MRWNPSLPCISIATWKHEMSAIWSQNQKLNDIKTNYYTTNSKVLRLDPYLGATAFFSCKIPLWNCNSTCVRSDHWKWNHGLDKRQFDDRFHNDFNAIWKAALWKIVYRFDENVFFMKKIAICDQTFWQQSWAPFCLIKVLSFACSI